MCIFFFCIICSEFCHTLKWKGLGFTCLPHPDPPLAGRILYPWATREDLRGCCESVPFTRAEVIIRSWGQQPSGTGQKGMWMCNPDRIAACLPSMGLLRDGASKPCCRLSGSQLLFAYIGLHFDSILGSRVPDFFLFYVPFPLALFFVTLTQATPALYFVELSACHFFGGISWYIFWYVWKETVVFESMLIMLTQCPVLNLDFNRVNICLL